MRKRNLHIVFFIVFISSFIISCKKGEDDPFLSLRSRKARICNKWKLSALNAKMANATDSVYWNVNEDRMTVYYSDGSTISLNYYMHFSIFKDGTYSIEHIYKYDDTVNHQYAYSDGRWSFLNKNNGYKNKERIILFPLKTINVTGSDTVQSLLLFQNAGEVLELDDLRNKRLVITNEFIRNNNDYTKSNSIFDSK